ncbi:beta-galactosidase [Bifidobacterium sp. ESL0764]|uniref:beta-galactosidase n=1 Tax=Bifidobacterium sp. ESL0764 TaxID=2983228 RepID=UPI0023F9BAFE|nr:beta-galactosidase [Bifidobacterium sp. ESL0764]WEV65333.1 beta-galactosidase [Bifidobacterium sp. ESL0764]
MSIHFHDLSGFEPNPIVALQLARSGYDTAPDGCSIGFTNGYMTVNGKPFFAICGECHYSRLPEERWDRELAKMAAGGINIVSTYIFWNHHEEHHHEWDFSGRRDLRHFVELCGSHGLKVIVRLGPFCHGEVRNGGLPDWLYGKPYAVRSTDQGFLEEVRDLYRHIALQLEGLYFKDGGPIIAAQLDNEYMHSGAPWELTTGISDEWVPVGADGADYIKALQAIAEEEGIDVPFYTSTGWGGSPAPKSALPLWGGYPYRPWLFYKTVGEHPLTDEYLYRDYHSPDCPRGEEFDPSYDPGTMPYACCEMGGGMFSSYKYRFILPMKSVDALANVKMGSGCNFLGYYMYHGGSNPVDNNVYLNESQVPKVSYDFQAPLGAFGQVRESYRRLKPLHYFAQAFADELCPLQTVIPSDQYSIRQDDMESLRWSLRTDGYRGFVYIDNFQDHARMDPVKDENIRLALADGSTVTFEHIGLASGENCILPFNMDLDGVKLVAATAQPVTVVHSGFEEKPTFVFLRPEGMKDCWFRFSDGKTVHCDSEPAIQRFEISNGASQVSILCVTRAVAEGMNVGDGDLLVFEDACDSVAEDGSTIVNDATVIYPYRGRIVAESTYRNPSIQVLSEGSLNEIIAERSSERLDGLADRVVVNRKSNTRYVITVSSCRQSEEIADLRLIIRYRGDVGWLWCGDTLVDDNFANGDLWEVSLKDYVSLLESNHNQLVLTITPLKKGLSVNAQSAMAARSEHVEEEVADLIGVALKPIYRSVYRLPGK